MVLIQAVNQRVALPLDLNFNLSLQGGVSLQGRQRRQQLLVLAKRMLRRYQLLVLVLAKRTRHLLWLRRREERVVLQLGAVVNEGLRKTKAAVRVVTARNVSPREKSKVHRHARQLQLVVTAILSRQ